MRVLFSFSSDNGENDDDDGDSDGGDGDDDGVGDDNNGTTMVLMKRLIILKVICRVEFDIRPIL